ncbi:MAG: hypothetical protein ACREGJ_01190 [Candidatus Saccharimonadales bacterium]
MTDNEKATAKLLVNPFSTVTASNEAFARHKPASAKEDWVLLNADLIKSIGADAWLENLLDALSLSSTDYDYDGHDIVNPTLAIVISKKLHVKQPHSIDRNKWISANTKLITEIGAAEWLWLLLEVLETGE